ncbi:hypothetical protein H6P81_021691 [Aristolochia fimbriata]|uniref:Uncharacterized protein n=1 Tax=Aristolochia fimbriata TaxID=158543 RepID=A0AAV7DQU3_ARIFI|nr:hypothetical protein H6P81_021691 [Aristolochia fimbriata]
MSHRFAPSARTAGPKHIKENKNVEPGGFPHRALESQPASHPCNCGGTSREPDLNRPGHRPPWGQERAGELAGPEAGRSYSGRRGQRALARHAKESGGTPRRGKGKKGHARRAKLKGMGLPGEAGPHPHGAAQTLLTHLLGKGYQMFWAAQGYTDVSNEVYSLYRQARGRRRSGFRRVNWRKDHCRFRLNPARPKRTRAAHDAPPGIAWRERVRQPVESLASIGSRRAWGQRARDGPGRQHTEQPLGRPSVPLKPCPVRTRGIPANHRVFERKLHLRPQVKGTPAGRHASTLPPPHGALLPHQARRVAGGSRLSSLPPGDGLAEKPLCPPRGRRRTLNPGWSALPTSGDSKCTLEALVEGIFLGPLPAGTRTGGRIADLHPRPGGNSAEFKHGASRGEETGWIPPSNGLRTEEPSMRIGWPRRSMGAAGQQPTDGPAQVPWNGAPERVTAPCPGPRRRGWAATLKSGCLGILACPPRAKAICPSASGMAHSALETRRERPKWPRHPFAQLEFFDLSRDSLAGPFGALSDLEKGSCGAYGALMARHARAGHQADGGAGAAAKWCTLDMR